VRKQFVPEVASVAIASGIAGSIRLALPGWFGDGAVLLSPVPEFVRRTWSFFLRFKVTVAAEEERAILVKIRREPGCETIAQAVAVQGLFPAARAEYSTLQAIAQRVAPVDPLSFCAVRPLQFLEMWNAIVMEELPARPLKELLMSARMVPGLEQDVSQLEATLQRAGRWLAVFHREAGALEVQPLDGPRVWQEACHLLERLGEHTGAAGTELIGNAFARRLSELEGATVPVALAHGDYSCANILVMADGRVTAFDAHAQRRDWIYGDLARLISELSTRKLQVLSYGRFIPEGRVRRYTRGVLDGYFDRNSPDWRLLHVAVALAITEKWLGNEEALAERPPVHVLAHPVLPIMRRYFRHLILGHLSAEPTAHVEPVAS
jgi:hypothetical protein